MPWACRGEVPGTSLIRGADVPFQRSELGVCVFHVEQKGLVGISGTFKIPAEVGCSTWNTDRAGGWSNPREVVHNQT
jgi:hypothetical protein